MIDKVKNLKDNLVDIVDNLIKELNEKEKRAINGRFGLSGRRETLSSIGKELGLSRERIRQIENNSLRKIRVEFSKIHSEKIEEIVAALIKSGGVVLDEKFSASLLKFVRNYKFGKNYLRLTFSICDEIARIEESSELLPGWRLSKLAKAKIVTTNEKIIDYLKEMDIPRELADLYNEIVGIGGESKEFVASCIGISAKIVEAKNGMIGLKIWPSVNPRNVRDKIYFVLKTVGKPLHFKEIAEEIIKFKFDNKRVVRATVHNELIADSRFVLIGRGIYALREWGYNDGTVLDVIKNILSNSKAPMSLGEIIALVNKSRKVKKNTILINLQTNKIFKKVGGGYTIEKL